MASCSAGAHSDSVRSHIRSSKLQLVWPEVLSHGIIFIEVLKFIPNEQPTVRRMGDPAEGLFGLPSASRWFVHPQLMLTKSVPAPLLRGSEDCSLSRRSSDRLGKPSAGPL